MLRKNCLVCDSENLKEIIHLGSHPFADTFIAESRIGEADHLYPLICDLCLNCSHVQTRCTTDPQARYAQHDYSYTSSNSSFSRSHWDSYCKEMLQKLNLKEKSFVVEVGSNDGYLSEQFQKSGMKVVGVDPSPYMAELARQRNVNTFVGLFEENMASKILNSNGKADLVIANNVFNHSDNPLSFAKAVSQLLSSEGSFVFEQPYWFDTIKSGKFDQIYHEHVSYLTVRSVKSLLNKAGMKIISAEVVNYHGGSLRIVAKLDSSNSSESESVSKMIKQEEEYGLFSESLYKKYMGDNLLKRNIFMEKIYKLKNEGASIIAVGAAAKGNTFLNFYNLDNTLIDYVTDSSPHKRGKYTPATRIPISGDEVFSKYEKVYALILSWNIAHQVKPILEKINPNIEFLIPD